MATAAQLKNLAEERISEAEVLAEFSKHAGVYYLAGYAVEFAFKVVICARLGVEMFDQQGNNIQKDISQRTSSAFLTHNLRDLLILSGLKSALDTDKIGDSELASAWSEVSEWSEQRRYDFGCSEQMAKNFLNDSKTVLVWIKNHWQEK